MDGYARYLNSSILTETYLLLKMGIFVEFAKSIQYLGFGTSVKVVRISAFVEYAKKMASISNTR